MDKKSATVLGTVGATLALAGVAILFIRRAIVRAQIDREYENERLLKRYEDELAMDQLPAKKRRVKAATAAHNGHRATH